MKSLSISTSYFTIKSYISLVKPGIIVGNLVMAIAGFALASRGAFDFWLFLAMIEGLSLIIASACVLNNYIDRELDSKMDRTKNRALVRGFVSPQNALIYAIILALFGTFFLALFTNLLSTIISLIGFFIYVVLYTLSKQRTIYATLVGSIAGAVPPIVGYCSVTNHFDLGAFILFMMMATWQIPHFFAIAIYRFEDYMRASIPIFPVKKGFLKTKVQMILYVAAFILASVMLTAFGYLGYLYCLVVAIMGFSWLILGIKGLTCSDDRRWARQMFFFSLFIVMALPIVIPFSTL